MIVAPSGLRLCAAPILPFAPAETLPQSVNGILPSFA
jgi:hypothetical protein